MLSIHILISVFILTFLFLKSYLKLKRLEPGNILFLFYIFVLIIFQYYLYQNELEINFIVIYFYLFTLIFASSLLFKISEIDKEILLPNQKVLTLIGFTFVLINTTQLINFQEIILDFYNAILIEFIEVSKIYNQNRTDDIYAVDSYNFLSIFSNSSREIIPLLLFFNLSYKKPNHLLTFMLIFSMITLTLISYSKGFRNLFIYYIFQIIFLFTVFSKFIVNSLLTKIKYYFFILIVFLLVPFSIITIGRFTTSYATKSIPESFLEYSGQSFYNLTKAFDYAIIGNDFRGGDRVIPLFKSIFYDDVKADFFSRLNFFNLPLDESSFSTWLGEFLLDFGVVNSILICFFFFLIFKMLLHSQKKLSIFNIVLFFIIWNIFTQGFLLFPYADISGNLRLLFLFCLILALNLFNKKTKNAV